MCVCGPQLMCYDSGDWITVKHDDNDLLDDGKKKKKKKRKHADEEDEIPEEDRGFNSSEYVLTRVVVVRDEVGVDERKKRAILLSQTRVRSSYIVFYSLVASDID